MDEYESLSCNNAFSFLQSQKLVLWETHEWECCFLNCIDEPIEFGGACVYQFTLNL